MLEMVLTEYSSNDGNWALSVRQARQAKIAGSTVRVNLVRFGQG
jgi:hypothetical protein